MSDVGQKRIKVAGVIETLPAPSHQALKSLHAYWVAKKSSRFAPPRSALDLEDLRALTPTMALAEVVGQPPRFRFRRFGSGLVEAYGEDVTGKFSDEIDLDWVGDKIHDEAVRVVEQRRISVAQIRFEKLGDGRFLQYERVLLPLSEDGETVNMILIGYVIEKAY